LRRNRALESKLVQIGHDLAALERAEALCRSQGHALGAYALQGAIAACHARAPTAGLARNVRERDLLLERAGGCPGNRCKPGNGSADGNDGLACTAPRREEAATG